MHNKSTAFELALLTSLLTSEMSNQTCANQPKVALSALKPQKHTNSVVFHITPSQKETEHSFITI